MKIGKFFRKYFSFLFLLAMVCTGCGPTSEVEKYSIRKGVVASGYTLTLDKTESPGGEDVSFSVSGESGYGVKVETTTGIEVSYDSLGNDAYTFEMPDFDVKISISAPIKFNVKFYDGNTLLSTAKVVKGEKIDSSAYPNTTKEGYNFVGWYNEATFETQFSSETKIESDKTLYGKWSEKKYTISLGTVADGYDVDLNGVAEAKAGETYMVNLVTK